CGRWPFRDGPRWRGRFRSRRGSLSRTPGAECRPSFRRPARRRAQLATAPAPQRPQRLSPSWLLCPRGEMLLQIQDTRFAYKAVKKASNVLGFGVLDGFSSEIRPKNPISEMEP